MQQDPLTLVASGGRAGADCMDPAVHCPKDIRLGIHVCLENVTEIIVHPRALSTSAFSTIRSLCVFLNLVIVSNYLS